MNENEKLMFTKYYNPGLQFTSIRNLYDAVRKEGVTLQEVKNYIQKQEVSQVFKKQKRVKHYFPIYAKHKFEILQIDLVDMSDISSANENYKYLLVAVDVFSRLSFAVPMKKKSIPTIVESMSEILDITEPKMINADKGSEWISREFKNLLRDRGITINYVDVGEHHKMGIVDRFVRTLREKINKYFTMYNTTKYINVLPQIIHGYNSSYHSGINKPPNKVDQEDEEVLEIMHKRYVKAKQEETKFNDGDIVRYVINRKAFEKKSLPKFSKTTHNIISHTEHTYTLDNGKSVKYYEIQLVKENEHVTREAKEPSREQLRRETHNERALRKEGLDLSNAVTKKRTRIETDRFHY